MWVKNRSIRNVNQMSVKYELRVFTIRLFNWYIIVTFIFRSVVYNLVSLLVSDREILLNNSLTGQHIYNKVCQTKNIRPLFTISLSIFTMLCLFTKTIIVQTFIKLILLCLSAYIYTVYTYIYIWSISFLIPETMFFNIKIKNLI